MLRLVVSILLAASGTASGLWGGYFMANRPGQSEADAAHGSPARETVFLTPEIFVIPILTDTEVSGFLVNRFVFGTDPSVLNESGIDDQTLLADMIYELAFNGPIYRPGETKVPDPSGVADLLLERANQLSSKPRFDSVFIQQLDYFNRSEVRRKVVEEREAPE